MRVLTALLLILSLSPFALPHPAAARQASSVGFQHRYMPDGTEIGIWYPASATAAAQRIGLYSQTVAEGAEIAGRRHPLIVMSHGNGGVYSGHYDTALALARAGFVVAALTHKGDNWQDQSRATFVESRPAALSGLISYMLNIWPDHRRLDPKRIGAFGFSSGGFTVLAAGGGVPDLTAIASHCATNPAFFDCRMLAENPRDFAQARSIRWTADHRIKAIVSAAPALGYTFGTRGLAGVRMPVQLWRAGRDHVLPAPLYADAVRVALPHPPEFHNVPNAGHFDFLAPCTPEATKQLPMICTSAPGFDRAAFHARFNAAVTGFFRRHLGDR